MTPTTHFTFVIKSTFNYTIQRMLVVNNQWIVVIVAHFENISFKHITAQLYTFA